VQKLASGAAFWAVEQGLEERALRESSLSLKRTVYLSTALGDEATRRPCGTSGSRVFHDEEMSL
jgi:hypothetical protein